jgi:tetratricopeptide (TPR) repeat protein
LNGEDDEDVAGVYNDIGTTYDSLKEYDEALAHYATAIRINITVNGKKDNIKVAEVEHNMAEVYCNQEKYGKSMKLFKSSLEVMIKEYGDDSEEVSDSYFGIGTVLLKQEEHSKALKMFNKCLTIRVEELGEDDDGVTETYGMIAEVYHGLYKYDKSLEMYMKQAQNIKSSLDTGETGTGTGTGTGT